MCGIAGIWDPNNTCPFSVSELTRIAANMATALEHRGPDGHGVWSDEHQRLAFGHRRLAILDLSATGRQPMSSADGRWILTYNGEIYNHPSIRDELQRAGRRFRGSSDTEILVEAIAQWGVESTLQKCRGMFAFAAWDARNGELTFARDRMGEKPLYVSVFNGGIAFASELKALRVIPGWRPVINRHALWDYLNFGYVCGDKAIYEGVAKVPPGAYLTIDARAIAGDSLDVLVSSATQYWRLADQPDLIEMPDDECSRHFEHLFQQSIAEQIVADVPVGAFLSGGLDSSLVVAIAATISSRPVRTFTIGYADDEYDESPWARRIATHLKTDHNELHLTEKDLLSTLPTMASVYDEPFADPSQVPTFLVSRFARESVKVALTGDGGDELFCGYNRYIQFKKASQLTDRLPATVRPLIAGLLESLPVSALDKVIHFARGTAGKGAPLQSAGARLHKLGHFMRLQSPHERYLALLSTGAPASIMRDPIEAARNSPAETLAQPGTIEDYLMRHDLRGYLPDNGLVKLDRASMATSLETRAPFLDQRIVEDACRLPIRQKLRDGKGKWILRAILARHLPVELFERPKAGFSVPVAAWLRGPLAEWLSDTLTAERIDRRGLLDAATVMRLVEQHRKGRADHARILWAIIILESWLSPELGSDPSMNSASLV